jgi:hypothetical protein
MLFLRRADDMSAIVGRSVNVCSLIYMLVVWEANVAGLSYNGFG